jgi:preprotein translocase subunit SecA
MFDILTGLFGSYNSRQIKKYMKVVDKINSLEDAVSNLSDDELASKTAHFKEQLQSGAGLNDILPEAFAVVREASKRVLGMRHFDVQLIGGMVLHDGCIAEMKTGEGKTLVATLAVYLNALDGKGVHVVTVNEYLARRDSEWMAKLYESLGLSVGCLTGNDSDGQKKVAYQADITYGTNHELGFDYLRDNLKQNQDDLVMRPFNFAVVDEVDSVLIDEARTPLIISGADDDSSALYASVDSIVRLLTKNDFEKDEKNKTVTLTDSGVEEVEKKLQELGLLKGNSLYDLKNIHLVYHVNCALKAHFIFTKDVDYIVKNREVVIIDEFTGRAMRGRRYSDGIHQAIEAKERVQIKSESRVMATISYQNFFRMYPKLSGMTGTAMTEAAEFEEIYKLKVISIPPNTTVKRIDENDSIFLSADERYEAVIDLIKKCKEKQQPVLVGTPSIENSEYLSSLLSKEGVKHSVLNARQNEEEATIVAEAGAPGAITIATNMAGRGTDIKLGGNVEMRVKAKCIGTESEEEIARITDTVKEEVDENRKIVEEAGGLFVIGTERNESRRIDNQLRGRSGRQGDPGVSKFFLSMDDELIKRFAGPGRDRIKGMKGQGIELTGRIMSKMVEKAQKGLEAYNFDIRKQLLEFDNVMNEQRKNFYEQRDNAIKSEGLRDDVLDMISDTIEEVTSKHIDINLHQDEWGMAAIDEEFGKIFDIEVNSRDVLRETNSDLGSFKKNLRSLILEKYQKMEEMYTNERMRNVERGVILEVLDKSWRDHLVAMEHLRRGINLRSYAQKNPLSEYKVESFELFQSMLSSARTEMLSSIFRYKENPLGMYFDNQNLDYEHRTNYGEAHDDGIDLDFIRDQVNAESILERLEASMKALRMLTDSVPGSEDKEIEDNKTGDQTDELSSYEEGNGETDYSQPTSDIESDSKDSKKDEKLVIEFKTNDLCFCGSGRRYKDCHGSIENLIMAATYDVSRLSSNANESYISEQENSEDIEAAQSQETIQNLNISYPLDDGQQHESDGEQEMNMKSEIPVDSTQITKTDDEESKIPETNEPEPEDDRPQDSAPMPKRSVKRKVSERQKTVTDENQTTNVETPVSPQKEPAKRKVAVRSITKKSIEPVAAVEQKIDEKNESEKKTPSVANDTTEKSDWIGEKTVKSETTKKKISSRRKRSNEDSIADVENTQQNTEKRLAKKNVDVLSNEILIKKSTSKITKSGKKAEVSDEAESKPRKKRVSKIPKDK